MNVLDIIKLVKSVDVKALWQKYGIFLFIIVCIYAGYKTFAPTVIKEEVKVVDTAQVDKLTQKVASLTSTNANLKTQIETAKKTMKDVNTVTVIKTLKHSDGTVETTTTVTKIDKTVVQNNTTSTSTSTSTSVSNSSGSSEHVVSSSTHIVETKIEKPLSDPKRNVLAGYLSNQEVLLGAGLNIGKSWAADVIGIYNIDTQKAAAGAVLQFRF